MNPTPDPPPSSDDTGIEGSHAPFDSWSAPAWYQSLAHEHAEHLLSIVHVLQGQAIRGASRDMLVRHVAFESDRYEAVLRRRLAELDPGDPDGAYHVERLRQHVATTRQWLVSGEVKPAFLVELLHHFIEEQALYLDDEAREKVLAAVHQAETQAQWTVGPLMEMR